LRTEERLHHISFSYVKTVLQRFFWTKKVYTWLLRYLRPDFVLVPNISHFALVAAAKECRIKTIELQHGFVASRSHVSYSWGEHVVKYKSRLPLADRFFVYGTYWKEQLMQKGFWQEEELRIIGSFRIDNYRSIKQQRVKSDNMCTIVWTSQGIHTQDAIDFMVKFVALAHKQVKYKLIVKLHPALETNKTPYEVGLQPDDYIQIYLGNEEPTTFELIAQADMHISISSTCHYEALALGVPTIILPLPTHENVLHLYEDGHALLVRTPQELLDSVIHWKNYKVSPEISNYYFEPDALTNMKREMGLIA
jgi:UDP-N-acetylglucosamine 2-epimerase